MATLKFRVSLEEDDSVYRDIVIKHKQNFQDLHYAILKAFEFDSKHQATFYRSNDDWDAGREISFEVYEKTYQAPPLLMSETVIGSEVQYTNQKFVYEYDFTKRWTFLIELIAVEKSENPKYNYPIMSRAEGIGPLQYGTRSILGNRFVDIEEKFDLLENAEGFGKEGEEDVTDLSENTEEESADNEDNNELFSDNMEE